MKKHKTETILVLLAGMVLAVSSRAQTNTASLTRPRTALARRPSIVATRVVTNAGPNLATVRFRLPRELSNYHVLEQRAHGTVAVTNLSATSQNEVQASLATGSTLMFVQKQSPRAANLNPTAGSNQLLCTYFMKATPAAQPGREPDTAEGELTMYTDVDPTPWDSSSNQYIAHLLLVFSTETPAATNSLLPLSVGLTCQNARSVTPRIVELEKANDIKEAVVICDTYQPDVEITAHYLTATNTIPLHLQKLTLPVMTQMIISKPMLFAALTGGLLGGLLRLFKGGEWGIKRILHYLAEGVVVGVAIVTLLLAQLLHGLIAGLPSQPQLVLAFALAVVAGSVGAHFLDALIRPMLGKQPAATS
jgi:hypothetical protein